MKKNLESLIHGSSAYPSTLHDKAKIKVCDPYSLIRFSREWFHITRAFGLNAPRSLETIARELLLLPIGSPETKVVETILQQASCIAVDDLGQARGKTTTERLVHFRLFEKQCGPLIEKFPDFNFYGDPELETTKILVSQISQEFTADILSVLTHFLIVEVTALEIVNAMYPLYMGCSEIYTSESVIEYITLHQGIEGEHSAESLGMIEAWLKIHPEQESMFEEKLKLRIYEWGAFWEETTEMLYP